MARGARSFCVMAIQVERHLPSGLHPNQGGHVTIPDPAGGQSIALADYLTQKEQRGAEVVSVSFDLVPPHGAALLVVLRVKD